MTQDIRNQNIGTQPPPHNDTAPHQNNTASQGQVDQARTNVAGIAAKAGQAVKDQSDDASKTLNRVSETVQNALGTAQDKASETYNQAADWTRDKYEKASSWASDQYDNKIQARKQTVQSFIQENPMMVGAVGLAAGLILGALLPRSRSEDRLMGSWSDNLKDQGRRYAEEAERQGREYASKAFQNDDSRPTGQDKDWDKNSKSQNRAGGSPTNPRTH